MMSRLTEEAQEALQRSQQIMFAKQQTQLDVEHIFLALLQQRNSLPAQIIAKLGGDTQEMIRELNDAVDGMPRTIGSRGVATSYITMRCNRVLQGAAEEADRLNDEFISTVHLLLAVAAERVGPSARILEEAIIDQEKILAVLPGVEREYPESGGRPAARIVKAIINPSTLEQPRGYNHGILTTGRRILFLSGQTALNVEGKIVAPGDVVGQYRQVLSNLKAVVEEAGGKMQDIVKVNIFVRDMEDYKRHLKELGQVHKEFFGSYYPATALLEISRFFDEAALIEIEGIAVLSGDDRR